MIKKYILPLQVKNKQRMEQAFILGSMVCTVANYLFLTQNTVTLRLASYKGQKGQG
jgi:hypothetical protein